MDKEASLADLSRSYLYRAYSSDYEHGGWSYGGLFLHRLSAVTLGPKDSFPIPLSHTQGRLCHSHSVEVLVCDMAVPLNNTCSLSIALTLDNLASFACVMLPHLWSLLALPSSWFLPAWDLLY